MVEISTICCNSVISFCCIPVYQIQFSATCGTAWINSSTISTSRSLSYAATYVKPLSCLSLPGLDTPETQQIAQQYLIMTKNVCWRNLSREETTFSSEAPSSYRRLRGRRLQDLWRGELIRARRSRAFKPITPVKGYRLEARSAAPIHGSWGRGRQTAARSAHAWIRQQRHTKC